MLSTPYARMYYRYATRHLLYPRQIQDLPFDFRHHAPQLAFPRLNPQPRCRRRVPSTRNVIVVYNLSVLQFICILRVFQIPRDARVLHALGGINHIQIFHLVVALNILDPIRGHKLSQAIRIRIIPLPLPRRLLLRLLSFFTFNNSNRDFPPLSYPTIPLPPCSGVASSSFGLIDA